MFKHVILAVAAALAATAFAAPAVSAQETPIELVDTETGEPCTPCVQHIVGESTITVPPNIVVSRCADEYVVTTYQNGTGEVRWSGTAMGAPGCNVTNCTAMSSHWSLGAVGERAPGREHVHVGMCLRTTSGTELECSVEFTVWEVFQHHYAYEASRTCGGTIWQFEAEDEGEVSPYELLHL